jgi:hypothetical protein
MCATSSPASRAARGCCPTRQARSLRHMITARSASWSIRRPPIIIDENFNPPGGNAQPYRDAGLNARSIFKIFGVTDDKILLYALRIGAEIVTKNGWDFRRFMTSYDIPAKLTSTAQFLQHLEDNYPRLFQFPYVNRNP